MLDAELVEDPSGHMGEQVVERGGAVVVRGHGRQDDGARLRHRDHVPQVDQAERRLAGGEDEPAPLLQADVGGPGQQVVAVAVGDRREGLHRARHDGHAHGRAGARGDVRGDVAAPVGHVAQGRDVGGAQAGLQLDGAVRGPGHHQVGLHRAEGAERGEQVDRELRRARAGDPHDQPGPPRGGGARLVTPVHGPPPRACPDGGGRRGRRAVRRAPVPRPRPPARRRAGSVRAGRRSPRR